MDKMVFDTLRMISLKKKKLSKHTFGENSVMVWRGFETKGTTSIVFAHGRMNSESYV